LLHATDSRRRPIDGASPGKDRNGEDRNRLTGRICLPKAQFCQAHRWLSLSDPVG